MDSGEEVEGCLVSSKGELWLWDHSSPLPVLSIMLLRIECVSMRVLLIVMKVQSSTNPVEFIFAFGNVDKVCVVEGVN